MLDGDDDGATGNAVAVGRYTSLAIGRDGLGLISSLDQFELRLRIAHCSDLACSTAEISLPDTPYVFNHDTSMTIGSDGLGLITAHDRSNFSLSAVHCSDVLCSTITAIPLDIAPSTNTSVYSSATIGTDGLGFISYFNFDTGSLKVAHCSDIFCLPYVRVN